MGFADTMPGIERELRRNDAELHRPGATAPLPDACETMSTPIGELLLLASAAGLTGIYFETHRHGPDPRAAMAPAGALPGPAAAILARARSQLAEYFAGRRTGFDLPLAARGTPFQQRVWRALLGVGFGEAISYSELARRIDAPRGVRAVGGANARNPLSIVVPCHRVIGADGSLTGFGGGLERKQWLLRHEAPDHWRKAEAGIS
jgi:methylated-DNA-[protein]-cysteine S-methyltransferase